MPDIFRYTTNSPRGSCDVCEPLDGLEGTEDELPLAPNPDCRHGSGGCRCSLELIGTGGGDGCYCFYLCPQEFWSDDCDCPDGSGPHDGGCCCLGEAPYWENDCHNCGGDGGGGGGGCECNNGDGCDAPDVCCEDIFGDCSCIYWEDCDDGC